MPAPLAEAPAIPGAFSSAQAQLAAQVDSTGLGPARGAAAGTGTGKLALVPADFKFAEDSEMVDSNGVSRVTAEPDQTLT